MSGHGYIYHVYHKSKKEPPNFAEYSQIFHFHFHPAEPVNGKPNIYLVTHIDSFSKLLCLCKLACVPNSQFITLSSEASNYLSYFIKSSAIRTWIPSTLHESFISAEPSKNYRPGLRFGLFCRLYPDNRKSSRLISELLALFASSSSLLIIYGSGYADHIKSHDTTNILLIDESFSLASYSKYLRSCDYILYPFWDEGAFSIVDSCSLNIPVIVSCQGFHKDLALPKYSIFTNSDDQFILLVSMILKSDSTRTNITDGMSTFLAGSHSQICENDIPLKSPYYFLFVMLFYPPPSFKKSRSIWYIHIITTILKAFVKSLLRSLHHCYKKVISANLLN